LGGGSVRAPFVIPSWVWGVAAGLMLMLVLWAAMMIFERHGLSGLSRTSQLYGRLLRFSGWLRIRWKESHTPLERGAAFALAVPDASDLIFQVANDYTREQYSLWEPDSSNAERLWRKLSPRLWVGGLRVRTQRPRQWIREVYFQAGKFLERMNRQLGGQIGD